MNPDIWCSCPQTNFQIDLNCALWAPVDMFSLQTGSVSVLLAGFALCEFNQLQSSTYCCWLSYHGCSPTPNQDKPALHQSTRGHYCKLWDLFKLSSCFEHLSYELSFILLSHFTVSSGSNFSKICKKVRQGKIINLINYNITRELYLFVHSISENKFITHQFFISLCFIFSKYSQCTFN